MEDDERRESRRFNLTLPLVVKQPLKEGEAVEATAETRDVSFRGLYFTIDKEFQPGSSIEVVMTLPKEITLAADVRIRCTGQIVRVEKPEESGKRGVAAVIERYEFLPFESQ